MSDFIANPSQKPKRFQVKLLPIQVEAIRARSSVRHSAADLLARTAEKTFPEASTPQSQAEPPELQDAMSTNVAGETNVANMSSIRRAIAASFDDERAA